MPEVTCILTSCGRFDLLYLTIESFLLHNTYHITEFIIYEDSAQPVPDELKKEFPFIRWIEPKFRKGQIVALDTLWHEVKTPYAFTMEDDWITTRGGFIEESLKILQDNPTILQVWLKGLEKNNNAPIDARQYYGIFKRGKELWAWHRFNPSLKRRSDYDLIAPFQKHTDFDPARGYKSEAAISKVYNQLGFTAAILPHQYIKHIGEGRRAL